MQTVNRVTKWGELRHINLFTPGNWGYPKI